jgi:hypothetical protein
MAIDGPNQSNHQISSPNPQAYEHGIYRGFSYGHAIFASIDTSCITIVIVFTGASVSPPLCPSLSVASQYGYYNDQIYFNVTATMYRPMHASLSTSFMAYLFSELKVMLRKSASTRHIINNYPLNML